MSDLGRIANLLKQLLKGNAPGDDLGADDWKRLADFAIRHSIASVLHSRVTSLRLRPPTAVLDLLARAHYNTLARNMRLLHELGGLLHALHQAGIQAIPLKGAFLADSVYPHVALRPMADVDLLVRPGDVAEAIKLLTHMGFTSEHRFEPVAAADFSQHMPPMSSSHGMPLELHWTIANPLTGLRLDGAEIDSLWARSTSAVVSGAPARALAPADLLLHVCMHVSIEHRFDHMAVRSFLDIAELVKRYQVDIDWPEFRERGGRWGVAAGVRLALVLAMEWTALSMPDGELDRLGGAPPDREVVDWAREKIIEGSSAAVRSPVVRFFGTRGAVSHLAALKSAVLPSGTGLAGSRATRLSWLSVWYYMGRPWRLWVRYRSDLVAFLRPNKALHAQFRKEALLRRYLGWP